MHILTVNGEMLVYSTECVLYSNPFMVGTRGVLATHADARILGDTSHTSIRRSSGASQSSQSRQTKRGKKRARSSLQVRQNLFAHTNHLCSARAYL